MIGGMSRRKIPPAITALLALVAATTALIPTASSAPNGHQAPEAPWNFAVSGDSRNCGDIIMPAIAAGAHQNKASFYWHLGDLRAIYDFDQDYRHLSPTGPIIDYLTNAWLDFQRSQIDPFGDMPFFLGIGNHETIPPKTREQFTLTFADWLDTPELRAQRLQDDPHDHQVRTYYHWIRAGVDFISLDNATPDQFDTSQLQWLQGVLQRDVNDAAIRAVVVGMHEALPESNARGHSMSDSPNGETSGVAVYNELLTVRKSKPVYVLASHSHFVMEGVFDTPYWREHGGVLPGWIIGTAGAIRYQLPSGTVQAKFAKTHVYGYLLATVSPRGSAVEDPIQFKFQELAEADTPANVVQRYGADFVHSCYEGNTQ
jgi:hypothetical protein